MYIVKTDIADAPARLESTYSRPVEPAPAPTMFDGMGRCLFSIVLSSMAAMLLSVCALTAVVYKLSGSADAAPLNRSVAIEVSTPLSVKADGAAMFAPPPGQPGPAMP